MNQSMSGESQTVEGVSYSSNIGPILRGLLNGVKQTAKSFAKIHNLDPNYLEGVMSGEKPMTQEIFDAVNDHSPLNVRQLFDDKYKNNFPIRDDTDNGVVTFSASQRESTERTFERGPKEGPKVPFYDYADTAMSTTSAFRPEWIKERYLHDGKSVEISDWAFNHGHFEYQMTYFIGPVNFHWIDRKGNKHVRQMNTGDMNYITPFVPHTFTTRVDGQGLILAVTYGGSVATEQFQAEIKSMSLADYAKTIKSKLPKIEGNLATDYLEGVIIRHHTQANAVENESYIIREIMGNVPHQLSTRAFEYSLKKATDEKSLDIKVDADRWGYNVGESDVLLIWDGKQKTIEPGASFFIQPNVPHAFRNTGNPEGKLVVMEIKPGAGNPYKDLALIYKYAGEGGLNRVHSETKQWF